MKLHLIGNGPSINHFPLDSEGIRIGCNIVESKYNCEWTMVVDWKPLGMIIEKQVECDTQVATTGFCIEAIKRRGLNRYKYKWLNNCKIFDQLDQGQKYTHIWSSIEGKLSVNSGHHSLWHGIKEFNPTEVHLWGCDSIAEDTIESLTDKYITDKNLKNGKSKSEIWREVWEIIIELNPNITFYIHTAQEPKLKKLQNMVYKPIKL